MWVRTNPPFHSPGYTRAGVQGVSRTGTVPDETNAFKSSSLRYSVLSYPKEDKIWSTNDALASGSEQLHENLGSHVKYNLNVHSYSLWLQKEV